MTSSHCTQNPKVPLNWLFRHERNSWFPNLQSIFGRRVMTAFRGTVSCFLLRLVFYLWLALVLSLLSPMWAWAVLSLLVLIDCSFPFCSVSYSLSLLS
jgi:hypothetical protein